MNLEDNFELRTRHPEVHQMSHDGDISFMACIPHKAHPESIRDEGCLIVNRVEPGIFREIFLQTFEENKFRKTTVSTFLTLGRTIVYDKGGNYLDTNWYNNNRLDKSETSPGKIMMLVPADWLAEAIAIKNYRDRAERRKVREEISKRESMESSRLAKPVIPIVNQVKRTNALDLYSPLRDLNEPETFTEVGHNEVNMAGYNNPANQGKLFFQESFNTPI
jgi:hypothetical protein